ncbi:SubName: Full=Uncharacterized protein {ECO:0000313/EMBL:CCA70557.1} [Serendipita indica DSM 11827]|nr:SubName: Full=Uncharacterized protein {ECO:0000313/EMBL:CCA70557.1} [Serendipita indica DSM 11827]
MSSREKQARWIGSSPSSAVPATFPWLFASKLHRSLANPVMSLGTQMTKATYA